MTFLDLLFSQARLPPLLTLRPPGVSRSTTGASLMTFRVIIAPSASLSTMRVRTSPAPRRDDSFSLRIWPPGGLFLLNHFLVTSAFSPLIPVLILTGGLMTWQPLAPPLSKHFVGLLAPAASAHGA